MKKAKATKRALLASVVSMLLCVAMLIGATFAWFSDSVTSGKNVIVTGTLDIELSAKRLVPEGTATSITGGDDEGYRYVSENTNLFEDGCLWEPGHVEVIFLKARNVGTLALKYALGINVAGENVGDDGEEYDVWSVPLPNAAPEGDEFKNVDGSYPVTHRKKIHLGDFIKYAVIGGKLNLKGTEEERQKLIAALEAPEGSGSKLIKDGLGNDVPIRLKYDPAKEEFDVPADQYEPCDFILKAPRYAEGGMLAADDESEEYITLVVYMPWSVDNEANWDVTYDGNYKGEAGATERTPLPPTVNLGINLYATQTPYEQDSFGTDYDEGIVIVNNAATLQTALTQGGTVDVTGDITMPSKNEAASRTQVGVAENENSTLVLRDGAKLTFEHQVENKQYNNVAALYVTGNGGTFTVSADSNAGIHSDFYCFDVNVIGSSEDKPALVIKDGDYHGFSIVNVQRGTVIIEGGTFTSEMSGAADEYKNADHSKWLLNCIDASYKAETANIIVRGGTFIGFNPADNTAEGKGTNFVAKGYHAEKDEDAEIWRVVPDVPNDPDDSGDPGNPSEED